jgi:serine/threonine-protein kinase
MEKLGRYQIVGELGRGGCGVVYRAADPKIGRQVAIKTIVAQPGSDPTSTSDLLVRLKREAQSAGVLSHPNIVTVHELDDEGDITYIVMEHVTGQNLRQIIAAGRLPDQTILSILRQAADALDYAHAQGVVHRDVKPANFLLTERGILKITDFGIAKVLNGETTGVTETGVMIGTTQYMSPEQIELHPVTGQSDQFSLAVLAYEMLTGRRPFQGDSPASLIHQILSVDPPPVETHRESLGPAVTQVLRRALAKKPEWRYPTCGDFVRELAAAIRDPHIVLATAEAPGYAGARASHSALGGRARLVWLLAGLAAAAVGIQSYRVLTTPTPASSVAGPQAMVAAAPSAMSSPPPGAERADVPSGAAPQRRSRRSEPLPDALREVTAAVQPVAEPPAQFSQPAPVPSKPEPPPAAATPTVPDPELPPGGKYRGPPEGNVTWTGVFPPQATLVMAGNRSSSGALLGRGLPVGIALLAEVHPADVRIVESPAPSNRYRLVLSNQGRSDISSITIRWREKPE